MFVIGTLAMSTFHTLLLVQIEHAFGTMDSVLMQALARNQLAVFLVANLATGVINMSMQTLLAGELAGIGITLAYVGVICAGAVSLHARNITLKLSGSSKPKKEKSKEI